MKDFNELILFENDRLIAIDKPAGLLSIEGGGNKEESDLRTILRERFGNIWAVHRLDKNTSGVILFAKDRTTHRNLNDQFQRHQIQKEYHAIFHGFPCWNQKTIQMPLQINGDRSHRTIYAIDGKNSESDVIVRKKGNRYSYFIIFPKTGFTHQIRSQLSFSGFPILGDRLYWQLGNIPCTYKPLFDKTLTFLHAYAIHFVDPKSLKTIGLVAPLPKYFLEALKLVD